MGIQTQQILNEMLKAYHGGREVSLRMMCDSSAARGICNRIGAGKVRSLAIKELWIQEEVRRKRLAIDAVDTSMNWADIGTKVHTKERLDSLMRQLPLVRTGSS